jgi:phage baseplate assembly protein gpV
MRRIATVVNVSLLAAGLCVATASAETKKVPSPHPAKLSATSTRAKASKPMAHTAVGTVESYDAAGKTLTVKGSKATWTFNAADARVWDGSKSVGLDDLSSHAGSKVTVKYTESGGQKSASSIRLTTSHHAKGSKS